MNLVDQCLAWLLQMDPPLTEGVMSLDQWLVRRFGLDPQAVLMVGCAAWGTIACWIMRWVEHRKAPPEEEP